MVKIVEEEIKISNLSQYSNLLRHLKIVLVQLDPEIPSLRGNIHFPRFGIIAIHSILTNEHYDVITLIESFTGKLSVNDILSENPNSVWFNSICCTVDRTREFALEIKKKGASIVLGGEYATLFPDDAKDFADFIVIGEGDETAVKLAGALKIKDASERERILYEIRGLAYKRIDGTWVKTTRARRVKPIRFRYDLSGVKESEVVTTMYRLTLMPIQSSRSCPHQCTFCTTGLLFGGKKYILRPPENVIHDMRHVWDYTGIKRFVFVDNLFGNDKVHTTNLLSSIIKLAEEKGEKPHIYVLCRPDQFTGDKPIIDGDQLDLMVEAGVREIVLGLESPNEKTLVSMQKRGSCLFYGEAVSRIKAKEIRVRSTFIAGVGEDSSKDIRGIAGFAKKISCDIIQIYGYRVLPGTRDYKVAKHLVIPGFPLKYLNGHSVSSFPRRMTPSQAQEAMIDSTEEFYSGSRDPLKRLNFANYRRVHQALQPIRNAFRRMDEQFLFNEGIYIRQGSRVRLVETKLRDSNQPDNYEAFRAKVVGFFQDQINQNSI